MPYSRAVATRIAKAFERIVAEEAMCGSGHPDLFDWHQEKLDMARERIILRLMGDKRHVPFPPQPEVEY